jgi:zinc protease
MNKVRFLIILCVWLVASVPASATTIHEVTSPKGIKAWLVEDHKLPLIAMQFAFRGGVEQDPSPKQGLANLTTELLTEGAGPYDAAAFQQKLSEHSIQLRFAASRDQLEGGLKTLSADRDLAFDMLQIALTKPRFDQADIDRQRAAQNAALRMQLGNPNWQARYALFQKIFGRHPYGQRRLGTSASLTTITQKDIRDFATQHLARDNLVLAVAGDITPKQLAAALDKIFGALPYHAILSSVADIEPVTDGAIILTQRQGTQTSLLFAMPGPKRNDPDWYAAEIANYILGGGGFESRLMQDVRDKKGLTYGIGTGLSPADHVGLIIGETATENTKTSEAWSIVHDTMQRFYDDGVTEKDMTAAKNYLTGSLALGLTSTDKIAGALVDMQLSHLGFDYLDRHNDLIRNVTAEDVERVIKTFFRPDRVTVSMVGMPANVTATETRILVRE